jgi:hypothetical protein
MANREQKKGREKKKPKKNKDPKPITGQRIASAPPPKAPGGR